MRARARSRAWSRARLDAAGRPDACGRARPSLPIDRVIQKVFPDDREVESTLGRSSSRSDETARRDRENAETSKMR